MRIIVLIIMILGVSGSCLAQIKQVARLELELYEEGADHTDILGPHGLIVHGRINIKGRGDLWSIRRFNTDLKLIDSTGFAISERMILTQSWLTDDFSALYFLFTEKAKRTYYKLLRFDTPTGKMSVKEAELPKGTFFNKMSVVGNSIFLSGTLDKKTALFLFDFEAGSFTNVNYIPLQKYSVIGMDVPAEEPMLMVTDAKGMGKGFSFRVSFFDEKGIPTFKPQAVISQPDYYCRSASLTLLGGNEYILTGSYSQGKKSTANGVYFTRYENDQQIMLKYHSFSGFKNFYEYLNPRQKERMEKKAEKKAKKGKEEFIEAYIASHPVFTFNGNYMYVGEIYYPTYRTEVYYTTGPNGQMMRQTRRVFDGYQYTHAVVLAMDKDGNKVYDHCFPMWSGFKPMTVRRFLRIVVGSDQADLLFGNGSTVKGMRITGNNIAELNYGEIETGNENDKVRWTSMTQTSYWYDNYFISYGSQSIKNSDENGKKRRTVFFVTKMQF
ncbi:MAG TPA: hypothetical protein PK637_10475 [Flavobacteriales bacterium]|nr:hypothetical protein [Flavobacteriales bacterium]HRE97182.1 hypothetical protein [Flavobacteriales bacterium]HRJ35008.1 hypothetical protein [Flavobacteriales bacterium]HRJ38676.1 hypothetical protein [Flavobacteriales bacterium]